MSARALYLLDCGSAEVDSGVAITLTRMGEKVLSPFTACLIETDEGPVLVDTGVNPEGVEDPIAAAGELARTLHLHLSEQHDIRVQLRELGVAPRDVRYVVMSHLHWDHAGGCRFFPGSTFVVQRAEYRFSLYPDNFCRSAYVRHLFEGMLNLRLLEGDAEVVPGVWVLPTPGHTPGHQSVIVSLPETGTVILARDAIPSLANIELDVPQAFSWSAATAVESMHRLVYLAKREKALLLPGHEPDCWKSMRRSPEGYR